MDRAPEAQGLSLKLPVAGGALEAYRLLGPRRFERPKKPFTRIALAAAHVVADPRSTKDPWLEPAIDWDATIAYRRHLWSWGLGLAEAMDTAQRGMGLDWTSSLELIGRTMDAARDVPGAVVFSGAGTDHVAQADVAGVIAAYEEQCAAIEKLGGRIILMASRALAASARSPDDYGRVYDRILGQVKAPVIIHWLGEMFDPALEGYWGSKDHHAAMDVCVDVIRRNAKKVDGIKISLLDKDKEIAMRRRLPAGVRMYTGDDFNFAELIEGDAQGHSDALLGIFDAIAPAASAALGALAAGDRTGYHEIFAPTVPLSRHIFRAPTRFYKTGVVFMAWLNGHQQHFVMVGGQQSARHLLHFAELFRLADAAGLLADPPLACARMKQLLAVHGAA
ncbi:MAG: dihydrodipicolinate synthase family protein [Betaproteobacteria bacterium]|nr:dihydrodipicolinate synthase family protein [Betaproteobacteria bacterium]MDH5220587.1 dihydrodipicolinate synthase family protein [Betaproteobacteria bacterium]MDH5352464.1 dihydrodipicolinate synthase family protein [Betaproteobacteria bacterium]